MAILTRRTMLALAPALTAAAQTAPAERCEAALARLLQGNRRYASNRLAHPDQDPQRRRQLSAEQHPFAVVLSCSDSRVPPEIIFDEGLGDLFVIRNAGHVVDDAVLGSVEYAVGHLHVPVVLVLGHSGCGAVGAAVEGLREAHLTSIVKSISPAVQQARSEKGDLRRNAVLANVRLAVSTLTRSQPLLAPQVERRQLKVVGAVYDLSTGLVTLL